MGRDSRSPKRDHHHRSSHRDRSRDRESSSKHKKHRKSSREHDEKRKYRDKDDYKSDSVSVKRYDTTQRGIDAARNRLRASLGTAISDLRAPDQKAGTSRGGGGQSDHDFSNSVSVFDTLNRQKAIEQIEQPGFAPSRFTSGQNNSVSGFGSNNKSSTVDESSEMKMHERAMFGAMWTSREIEQKLAKKNGGTAKSIPSDEVMEDDDDENGDDDEKDVKPFDESARRAPTNDSIAHEKLSADPAIRQAKWLEIFRHRRRALLEGH